MPEEQNTPAEGSETENTGSESQESDEGTQNTEGNDDEKGSQKDSKDEAEKKVEADLDEEPPVRKTHLDFIAERKQRKLEKIKQAKIAKLNEELKTYGIEDDEEDFDNIEDDDEKKIAKTMKKYFGESIETIRSKELETEIDKFVKTDERFEPFKAQIAKWAKHPAYANLPIDRLAYAVAGPNLAKAIIEKKKELEDEADKSKLGGGSTRRGEVKKSVNDMSSQEFEDYLHKIRTKGA